MNLESPATIYELQQAWVDLRLDIHKGGYRVRVVDGHGATVTGVARGKLEATAGSIVDALGRLIGVAAGDLEAALFEQSLVERGVIR